MLSSVARNLVGSRGMQTSSFLLQTPYKKNAVTTVPWWSGNAVIVTALISNLVLTASVGRASGVKTCAKLFVRLTPLWRPLRKGASRRKRVVRALRGFLSDFWIIWCDLRTNLTGSLKRISSFINRTLLLHLGACEDFLIKKKMYWRYVL